MRNLEGSVGWATRGERVVRARWLFAVLLIVAVAFPSQASSTQQVSCSGAISPGGHATCVTGFWLPHFTPDDAIDYDTLLARIASPQAYSWRVHAKVADGRGKVYFAWECVARRSMTAGHSTAYFDKSCQAWRKLAKAKNGQPQTYYKADTSKPQTLTVNAWVGGCAPSCRFEAAADYLLAG